MEISRAYIQELALTRFLKTGYLFVEYVMGSGKTKIAIDIIRKVKELVGSPSFKCLYICHTIVSRDYTTPDEFRVWDASYLITSGEVTLVQYEGLDELAHHHYDLVILDEAHMITERRYSFFQRNTCDRILIIGGTRPDNPDKMRMIDVLCQGNILKYDMVQGIKYGTINDIIFKIVEVRMSDYESDQYARLNYMMSMARAQMPQSEKWLRKAIGDRLWWVYKSNTKLKAMMYMANGMREKDRRFLMFTSTKEQARMLSRYTMYSGKSDADFKSFCRGEINELCSVKQIEVGANIPNLKYALAQQINSKKHNIRQLAGRLFRGEPGEVANFWIIVLCDSIDEVWVSDAMRGIPQSKIKRFKLPREEFETIKVHT